jgi:plastocyanin
MSRTLAGACVAAMIGCGGGGSPIEPPPPPPPASILTTVHVDPSVTVYNTSPGNVFALTVALRDQNNVAYTGANSKSFSSSSTAVVTVSGDGTVTGVTVGIAQVTVTAQAGSVSRTATTIVTVQEPAAVASVETHEVRFEPLAVHIIRGGSVTWLIGRQGNPIGHNVTFATSGAPANIPRTEGGALVSLLFPTAGSFAYECTLHAGMTGTVHVH